MRPRAQERERTHSGVVVDLGLRPVRTGDRGPGPDHHVGERAVRSDDGAGGDPAATVQLGSGQQSDVLLELDLHIDPGGGRVHHGDAGLHPGGDHPAVQLGAERGQLHPVVHPFDQHRIVGGHRAHRTAVGTGEGDHIGEVDLALGVVPVQPAQRAAQHTGLHHIHRGVDLTDLQLIGCGVLLLHDLGDLTVGAAHHSAVPARVGEVRGEHGDGVAIGLVRLEQRGQRAGIQQRHIAGEDDHRPVEPGAGLVQCREPALHRPAGARDLVLVRDHRVGVELTHVRRHLLPFVPHHDGDPLGAQVPRRGEHVAEEAAAADPVQHLRGRGSHPRPLAGGENDHCCRWRQAHAIHCSGHRGARPTRRWLVGLGALSLLPGAGRRYPELRSTR